MRTEWPPCSILGIPRTCTVAAHVHHQLRHSGLLKHLSTFRRWQPDCAHLGCKSKLIQCCHTLTLAPSVPAAAAWAASKTGRKRRRRTTSSGGARQTSICVAARCWSLATSMHMNTAAFERVLCRRSSGAGGGTKGPSTIDKRLQEQKCPYCERVFKQVAPTARLPEADAHNIVHVSTVDFGACTRATSRCSLLAPWDAADMASCPAAQPLQGAPAEQACGRGGGDSSAWRWCSRSLGCAAGAPRLAVARCVLNPFSNDNNLWSLSLLTMQCSLLREGGKLTSADT